MTTDTYTGPWYAGLTHAEADARWAHMLDAAVDWQYLTVKAGGMARKCDLDSHLRARFGLAHDEAHAISNAVESRDDFRVSLDGLRWTASRPEPQDGPAEADPGDALDLLDPETNTELAQANGYLFDDTAALPLFSGTPYHGRHERFEPQPAPPKQLGMF